VHNYITSHFNLHTARRVHRGLVTDLLRQSIGLPKLSSKTRLKSMQK
jgi:hypothetical protein